MTMMLNTVERYSKTHRYDINPAKSASIVYNARSADHTPIFQLNDDDIPEVPNTTHLGIVRTKKGNADVESKIISGRNTAYALLGAGLHGRSGLKQDIKAHIWRTFVVPRLTYGMEVIFINTTDLKKLETLQSKMVKQIQHLPDRVANSAALALLGIPPIDSQIHKNLLNLIYNILKTPDSIEYDVACRQFATKTIDDKSIFSYARNLLMHYDLPSVYSLMKTLPSKQAWKKMLNNAINNDVEKRWREDTGEKPSLRYLNQDVLRVGSAHHIYTSVKPIRHDIQKAEIKAKLLTGTYTLQANRAAFNQHTVDPTCKICSQEPETREHFISSCIASDDPSKKCRDLIREILQSYPSIAFDGLLYEPNSFAHLILDCTHSDAIPLQLRKQDVKDIEIISREYIMRLHMSRCRQLAKLALDTG